MPKNTPACSFFTKTLLLAAFLALSTGFQLPLTICVQHASLLHQPLQPLRVPVLPQTASIHHLTLSTRAVGLRMGTKDGVWTPDKAPAGLWTPEGEIYIETELTEKMEERPLLEAEWEVMLGQSDDLRTVAKSGVLMQEITNAGEDLGGVNVTEVGRRSVGEELDLEFVFAQFKALLAEEKGFNPGMAIAASRVISACFRKSKQSWMESLGALQVLGFDPDSFITKQGATKVVNLDVVCLHLAGMMAMEENVLAEGGYSPEVLTGVKNFAVGVARVLLRYALVEEVLKRQPKAGGFNLVVTSRAAAFIDKEGILLPEGADKNILRSDFEPTLEWKEIDATVGGQPAKALLVSVATVDAWLSEELGMGQGSKIITA